MTYSMKTLAEAANMPYETVRYYCKIGLVPGASRDENNYRVFNEDHVAWLRGLGCLRDCGMSIEQMREYMHLCMQGPEAVPERLAMVLAQRVIVQEKMARLKEMLEFIDQKESYYQAILAGDIPYEAVFTAADLARV